MLCTFSTFLYPADVFYNVTITAMITSQLKCGQFSITRGHFAPASRLQPRIFLTFTNVNKQTEPHGGHTSSNRTRLWPLCHLAPRLWAGRNKHTSWQLWMSSREGGLVTVSRPDTGVVRSLLSGGRRKHSAYSPAFITSLESSDGLSARHKHLACALRPYRTALPAMFAWSGHHGANGPSRPRAAAWGTRLTRFRFEKARLAPQSVHLCFS